MTMFIAGIAIAVLVSSVLSTVICTQLAVGPQGAKGDTGDVGPQGEKGDTGDTGLAGEQGETGAQGQKGDTGDTGPQGLQGEKGDTGEQGPYAPDYDSGWIDVSGLNGKYLTLMHGLDTTDYIVDITGKATADGEEHQNQLGTTGYMYGFSQAYGGANSDVGQSVVQTSDGGYVIAGSTYSFGAGNADGWLVKIDAIGNIQWSQTYGGASVDIGYSVVETVDGGYAIAGYTEGDVWLFKTDDKGNMLWSQAYEGITEDCGYSVVQTSDGGYVIAGITYSFGAGSADVWLIKTDATGNIQWNQTYGGASIDMGYSVVKTVDGGYVITGQTASFGAGNYDVWLVKTDDEGNLLWNQTYGGTGSDIGYTVVATSDGGYAIAAYTYSGGNSDVWLVKTDGMGNMLWNQTYGGTSDDEGRSVVETSTGGYALAGYTWSFGAGGVDVWLVKTDAEGNMLWNQTYGGSNDDWGYSVVETVDGGYAIACKTASFGAGNYDVWLVKSDVESGLAWTETNSAANTITLYRGKTDTYWNYVRVKIWNID